MASKGKALAKMGQGTSAPATKGTKAEQRVTKALTNTKGKAIPFPEASTKPTQTMEVGDFTPASPRNFKARPTSTQR